MVVNFASAPDLPADMLEENLRLGARTLAQFTDARHADSLFDIQLVINNAGVYGPKGLTLDSVKAEDMALTFQTNAIGPLLVVQQLLRNKLIGKPGSIIGNMTSKVELMTYLHSV